MPKTETKEKDCQGMCPVCGSVDVEFVDSEQYDNSETDYFECLQCNTKFHEEYAVVRDYRITEYEVEIPLNDRTLFD